MSANQPVSFDTNDPQGALGLLDTLLASDNMNFNRATHNAIARAVATLSGVIMSAAAQTENMKTKDELLEIRAAEIESLKAQLAALGGPRPVAEASEEISASQSAS